MMSRDDQNVKSGEALCWFDAARTTAIRSAFDALEDLVQREIASKNPRCVASGRCCHFETWGHRLYVTGLETARCLLRIGAAPDVEAIEAAMEGDRCPFLVDERCSIHLLKPLGCRIYFCDPDAQTWQNDLYERCHAKIERIHADFDLPYRYGEWRSMLRLCASAEILPTGSGFPDRGRAYLQVRINA